MLESGDKDVKVAIIIMFNEIKSILRVEKKRRSQQRNRNYYFKNMDSLELKNIFTI